MKKLFISADIEGISSTTKWTDTIPAERDYPKHAEQMSEEVLAACEAALEMGFEDILVNDAHGPGTNIDIFRFPKQVRFVRGWEGHPMEMVQGIDHDPFDAAAFIGYHSESGSMGNPMSHTLTLKNNGVTINGLPGSEFLIYSWAAASVGVPTVYPSGDRALCEWSKQQMPHLTTTAVKEGFGGSTLSVSPKNAVSMIHQDMKTALGRENFSECLVSLPDQFDVEVRYRDHTDARRLSYFPRVTQKDNLTLCFSSRDYFEVLRTLLFIL